MAKPLVISGWQAGIAQSPIVGFGNMRSVDVHTKPGVARINYKTAKQSSTTITATPKWTVRDPNSISDFWCMDASGKVYKGASGGTSWSHVSGNTTGGAGQGLIIWKDYLFAARSNAIDVYGPLSSSPTWSNSWKSIDSDTLYHPMIIGQDDILYGGAGRYIFSLRENIGSTFAPGTAGTYTWNSQALDLPANYRVKCLAEQGENLMIGTWMGTNSYDFRVADIFPWDRTSDTFGLPIRINDFGINSMVNLGNIIYGACGVEAKIFVTNGVQANIIAKIPASIQNANYYAGIAREMYPDAMKVFRDRVFIGITGDSLGGSCGVWSLLESGGKNVLNHEYTISTGSDGSSTAVHIGSIYPVGTNTLMIGWKDDTTYGIDITSNSLLVSSYGAYIESPFYQVGTHHNKRAFTSVEVQLANNLASGEAVKIQFRHSLADSWTDMVDFTFANYGAVASMVANALIGDADFIQLKILLTTGASSTTTPELISVTLA